MRKVLAFALLLLLGLTLSQTVPLLLPAAWAAATPWVKLLTVTGLAFIMIRVGHEFELDRGNLRAYGKDYLVAMSAAALPWVLVALYFVLVLLPASAAGSWDAWKESLLAGRFAAPTSAGVLFAMLAAAGLAATWTFQKARVLAIFDDIDTILLMIPLQMLLVGAAWQLGVVVVVMVALLWAAWRWMHRLHVPHSWPWVLAYAAGLAALTEGVYWGSKLADSSVPIHLEVLLPAFVLGCLMKRPPFEMPDRRGERAASVVSGAFMVLVGLSLPPVLAPVVTHATFTSSQPFPGWGVLALHVLALTVLSNLGKMLPLLCYRREARLRERLALSVAMWPRGEVGAGVLVVSLGYGLGGPALTAAMLSLALNLVLTGVFILLVRRLVEPPRIPTRLPTRTPRPMPTVTPRQGPSWHG